MIPILARWFHDASPYFSLSLSLDHWFFRCRHDEQVWLWQIFLARWFFPNFSRPWRGTICKILEFFLLGQNSWGNSSSCKAKCSFAMLIGGLSNSFNMFFCLFAMYFFLRFLFGSFICRKKPSFQKLGDTYRRPAAKMKTSLRGTRPSCCLEETHLLRRKNLRPDWVIDRESQVLFLHFFFQKVGVWWSKLYLQKKVDSTYMR